MGQTLIFVKKIHFQIQCILCLNLGLPINIQYVIYNIDTEKRYRPFLVNCLLGKDLNQITEKNHPSLKIHLKELNRVCFLVDLFALLTFVHNFVPQSFLQID